MRISIIFALGFCLALPVITSAADWPHFRGINGDAVSAETGINKDWTATPPTTVWTIPVTDGGYSGPAVAGGIVYFVDHTSKIDKVQEDIVRAFDLATGIEKWKVNYPDSVTENYGFNRSTPAIDSGMIYYINSAGDVFCLKQTDGTQVWKKNLITDFGGVKLDFKFSVSPFIDGNKLIIVPGGAGKTVVALDKTTGETIWAGGGSDIAGYSTPVAATINGKKQYLVFAGTSLISVDPDNGNLLWSYPWANDYKVNAALPIVIGDSVFITSGYGRGCTLLDIKDGKATARWENKEIISQMNTPLLIDGLLYGTSEPLPGNLVCLDPATGKALWKQPGFEKGGLMAVDGTVIIVDGKSGDVTMATVNKDGYKALGKFSPYNKVDPINKGLNSFWAPPIFADGNLLVRSKKELTCIKLK